MQTCLIADDHVMMREALTGAVQFGWPDVVVSQAGDFMSAWQAAAAQPDLIISDLAMPGASPTDGIRRLRDVAPASSILVVTGNEDDELLIALFDAGIAGFVPKTAKSAVIEAAIRLVLAGARYIPPRLLELAARREPAASYVKPRLTDRQIDVLRLIATGQSNKEIARELDLSPATVKAHLSAAMAAMGASNRAEAAFKARTLGAI